MEIKIKNWETFQHYSNRRPPWIKLYRELLDDPEFHELEGDLFKYLVMMWLIASEDKERLGKLPPKKALCFRLRVNEAKLDKIINGLSHWLDTCYQDASNMLADGLQDAIPETETETETETKTREDLALTAPPKEKALKKKKKNKFPPRFGVEVWLAYKKGYMARYGIEPKRNSKQNDICCQLRDRLGLEDAVGVAEWYSSIKNGYHVGRGHALGLLLSDCETICTQWKTGRQITQAGAREGDRLQKTGAGWEQAINEVCDE